MRTVTTLAVILFGMSLLCLWRPSVSAEDKTLQNTPSPIIVGAQKVSAEGRVMTYPGAEVTVSADFTGLLRSLTVKEGDEVKQGQVLASIHAEDVQAALEQAKARAMENDAEIKLAQSEFTRAQNLMVKGSSSRQEFDKAERNLSAVKAHYTTDLTETHRLQAVLNKAQITAPIAGVIIERHIDAGEAVKPGTPIVTIADLSRLRIEAEVDEYDVGRVSLHAPVQINAEGFDSTWTGQIEEIPDSVTTRRIKPQDPARPVDTRVLIVKISLDTNIPLKLGQRVSVSIGS